jgi:hypothetical protein
MTVPPAERFSGLINDKQRADFEWLAETIRDQQISVLLFGYCTAIAVEHQDWTFWQVLHEAHQKFIMKRKLIS